MNRKDAPEGAKKILKALDHHYSGSCPCEDYIDDHALRNLIDELRVVYDIFYTPDNAEVEKDWKAESDKWETMYRTASAQLDRTSATLYSTETALKAMKNRVRKAEGTYIHPDDDDSEDYDDEVSAVEWKARGRRDYTMLLKKLRKEAT